MWVAAADVGVFVANVRMRIISETLAALSQVASEWVRGRPARST